MTADEARSPRHAPGIDAGGGRRPRSPLGPRRGNLRRRSVPGRLHGHRGGAGFSGRRHLQRQEAHHRHAQTLRRARPAGIRHKLRAGQRFRARAARRRFSSRSTRRSRRAAPSASWRPTTKSTACRRTPTNGCCATCCARNGDFRASWFRIITRSGNWATAPTPTATIVAADEQRGLRAGRQSRREHRVARAGLLPAPRRTGYARACSRNRSSMNWSRRCCCGNSRWDLFDDPYVDPDEAERIVGCERTPRTGAPGCTGNHHASEERRQPCAAESASNQNHRRHRPECRPSIAGRLQRTAQAQRLRCSTASRPASAIA